MFDIILNQPFGSLLHFIMKFAGSYGLTLIVFTIVVKIILLPLGILQHRSTLKQISLRPKEAAIRKKYGNDKQKLNTAIAELYSQEKVNPAAGCLPLLVQLPILLGLYKVIREPLTFVLKMSTETIAALDAALVSNGFIAESIINAVKQDFYAQAHLAEAMYNNFEALVNQGIVAASTIPVNYNFLGMNLAEQPTLALNMLILIPILSGFTAFLQSAYQMKTQPVSGGTQNNMKSMLYTMPLVSVWIAFTMPAAMGLYWSISNVCMIFQTMLLNAIWSPKKALAAAEIKYAQEEKEKKHNKKNHVEPVEEDPSLKKYIPSTRIPSHLDDEV